MAPSVEALDPGVKLPAPTLIRSIGTFQLTLYGLGSMLGSGIYGLIGQAAGQVGNAVWASFLVAMVAALLTALSYASLGSRYPRAGGAAFVTQKAYGMPLLSFVVGLAVVCSGLVSVATQSQVFARNFAVLLGLDAWPVWATAAGFLLIMSGLVLRGIRESGAVLAIPTYAFIVGVGAMLIWGFVEIFVLDRDVTAETSEFGLKAEDSHLAGIAFVFLIARAFSSGCAALTGVEAISNGVPAFRKPKSRNAAATLMMLGAFSITLLLGIVVLAQEIGAKYVMDPANDLVGAPENYHQKSMIAQLSLAVFGEGSPAFYFVAAATALILILAANTAFNGFPLLASVLAQDRYLPRQMHTRGDRLAFSNGILFLAIAAMIFVISFGAEVTVLIQLYIVGVFVSFTLSQTGMVRHWTRLLRTETDPQSRKRMFQSRIVNSVGLVMTAIVLVVVLITKFTAGAWIAIVLMVAVFVLMKLIHSHYASVQEELDRDDESAVLPSRTHSIVLVSGLNLATRRAVRYARATRPDMLEAITVNVDDRSTRTLVSLWEASEIEIPLKVIASPYREITRPVLDYVRRVRRESPRDVVTVFIPEYVVGHWWEQTLHNQSALRLKTRLLYERGVMVTSVPWQLDSSDRRKNRDLTVYGPGDTRRGMDGTERR